jgi:hypothetical protein
MVGYNGRPYIISPGQALNSLCLIHERASCGYLSTLFDVSRLLVHHVNASCELESNMMGMWLWVHPAQSSRAPLYRPPRLVFDECPFGRVPLLFVFFLIWMETSDLHIASKRLFALSLGMFNFMPTAWVWQDGRMSRGRIYVFKRIPDCADGVWTRGPLSFRSNHCHSIIHT